MFFDVSGFYLLQAPECSLMCLVSIYSRLLSVVAFYLLAGVLYKRIMLHAKGKEQIPNISFWEDFGNLQAVSILARSYTKPF